ncbi:MAG: STAS domain-containing protein [Candidatus Omnitrophota bacterium]|nr:STAS domain-containing protein [Candidatus Omnitrophota bacterium]
MRIITLDILKKGGHMALRVSVTEREQGIFVIMPSGAIDSNSYKVLEDEVDKILRLSPKVMVLDMEEVNYMSSVGVRIVFKAQKALKEKNAALTIVNLKPQIKKVFDIINAVPDLSIFASIEELDKYLDEMQKRAGG